MEEELQDIEYNPTKLGMAVSRITKRLLSPSFEGAQEALKRIMAAAKKKCLVLIDSLETYQLGDKITNAIISSLIDEIEELYTKKK